MPRTCRSVAGAGHLVNHEPSRFFRVAVHVGYLNTLGSVNLIMPHVDLVLLNNYMGMCDGHLHRVKSLVLRLNNIQVSSTRLRTMYIVGISPNCQTTYMKNKRHDFDQGRKAEIGILSTLRNVEDII